jgi:phosphoglycolate phosphatase
MTSTDGVEYDFWLFDLDGTLVDTEWDYQRRVFDAVGSRLGRSFSDREATVLWHGLGGSRNANLETMGVDPERFWEIFHDVEDGHERAKATYVYDDAAALLSVLSERDVPMGIVTHSQSYLANPVLERLDLKRYFETVISCNEDVGWKPDPAPVELAMERLGVAHNGHVGSLTGDSPQDVKAAHNAGIDAIHVERFETGIRERPIDGARQVENLRHLLE